MAADRAAALRRAYADELKALARMTYAPAIDAFASVPRERFLGPGPWRLFGGDLQAQMTPDADLAHIYQNVLVELKGDKRLNNGEPRFWAVLFDRLRPAVGERVIHVGAGTGYYTALLAHMVGPAGAVTGIEFEPDLAVRAAASLAHAPNVEILSGDGMALAAGEADVIVASCGLDVVPLAWVRLLRDGGRLLIPLTATMVEWVGGGGGCNLMITRSGARYSAEWIGAVAIYNCMSGRSTDASARIRAAMGFPSDAAGWATWTPPPIGSLRLTDAIDAGTVLVGDGWQLSSAPP